MGRCWQGTAIRRWSPRYASRLAGHFRTREHPDVIVGIKARLGHQMAGKDPAPALRLAREAADMLGLPLMVHVIDMRPPIGWLLPYLGRGDIITHCFHGNPGGTGMGLPEVIRATTAAPAQAAGQDRLGALAPGPVRGS